MDTRKRIYKFLSTERWNDSAIFFMRIFAGVLMLIHGIGKINNYEMLFTTFPDPLGIGSEASLVLIIGAETICSLLLIVGLAGGGSIPQVSGQAIAVLCYLFLLSAVAFSIWTTLLKYNDAGKVCIFNSHSPVFGTFLSILILNEDSFQPRYLLSLLLVCGGVYLVNRTVRRKE